MAFPTVKVELAFGSGFTDTAASRTWTDVTSYVSGADGLAITYGRSDEQQQPSPNTLSLTFENVLGDFTPGYASSTFYPNVVKGVPIRVTFTYTGASVRYVGYVNEWPVQWPTGSNLFATTTITAASRRARLGQSAAFTQSAIRRAYMATSPLAYWPMTEDADSLDPNNGVRPVFHDVTGVLANQTFEGSVIEAFWTDDTLKPVVQDGTAGPTDETSLVRFPSFSTTSLLDHYVHYAGGSGLFRIPASSGFTIMCVGRFNATTASAANVQGDVMTVWSASARQQLALEVAWDPTDNYGVAWQISASDPLTGASLDFELGTSFGAAAAGVFDGGLHHFALTLTGSNTATAYVDGTSLGSVTLAGAVTIAEPLTQFALGTNTLNVTSWLGHAAVHARALSPTEIASCAAAAISANESISTRVNRLATYLGVPAAEISVETSIAPALGPQTELSQTAASIMDAVATTTGGVFFDARDGTLTMQARNHRYNTTSVVTLGTSGEEIEADLTLAYDDRYLINTVEVSRQGTDQTAALALSDTASVDQYGVYNPGAYTLVTSLDEEAEAFGWDQLYRFAQPKVRVSAVTVDVNDLSSAQRTLVLSLDIGTKITLTGLPVQAGASSMDLFVEGYSESYSTTGKHLITFNTTPASGYPSMAVVGTNVVGSSTFVVY